MPRIVSIALVFAGLAFAPLAASFAEDVPPDANGVPKEIPKDQKEAPKGQQPAVGWSVQNFGPEQQQRMLRFSTFVNQSIPENYLTAENDVGYTVRAISQGGPLYWAHCQKCHGDTGLGNGDLAYALTPSPALLAYMVQQPIAVDQYLLWSISEGGKQFGTAMPSFKSTLSEEQIWQVVAYLRAGFPAIEAGDAPAKNGGAAKTDTPDLKKHKAD